MNETLHLLHWGTDYGLCHNDQDVISGRWTSWLSLNGSLGSSPAVAASPSLNRVDVVVEGVTGAIYHRGLINGGWWAWDSPAGGITFVTPPGSEDGRPLHLCLRGAGNDPWYKP